MNIHRTVMPLRVEHCKTVNIEISNHKIDLKEMSQMTSGNLENYNLVFILDVSFNRNRTTKQTC